MEVAEKYYDSYWKKKGAYPEMSWRHQKAFDFVKENSKVLEIGCGDGVLGKELIEKKNCSVTGVDFSSDALLKAKKRGLKTIKLNIEKEWPFKKNQFDYVIGLELLEHLFNPGELLKKIKLTSKHAIFSYANTAYLKNRLNILSGRVPNDTPFCHGEHLHYWTYNSFVDFVSKHFAVEEIKLLGHLPGLTRFLSFEQRDFVGKLWPNLLSNGTVVKCKPK